MSVTIADIEFDRVEYDADADVLYLLGGGPSRAVDYDETPEGHAVCFDRNGDPVGLTLVRPKRLLERNGELRVYFVLLQSQPLVDEVQRRSQEEARPVGVPAKTLKAVLSG